MTRARRSSLVGRCAALRAWAWAGQEPINHRPASLRNRPVRAMARRRRKRPSIPMLPPGADDRPPNIICNILAWQRLTNYSIRGWNFSQQESGEIIYVLYDLMRTILLLLLEVLKIGNWCSAGRWPSLLAIKGVRLIVWLRREGHPFFKTLLFSLSVMGSVEGLV